MKEFKFVFLIFLLLSASCKKEQDMVTTQALHGQVYNMCTDSGLVNCTVFLKLNGSNIAQMQSGASGNFTFNNVQIHSSSSYTYALATIDNPDGGGGLPPIWGASVAIEKGNSNRPYILQVIPETLQWYLYFPSGVSVVSTDTIFLSLQQKVFHKNLPNGVYVSSLYNCPTYTFSGIHNNYISDESFSWMGWWFSTLIKTKNGITTNKTDSFYVPWNASSTDTIPW